jgi:hypothetical protein
MNRVYSKNITLALLALVMAATRLSPLSGLAHLQDASWAVFFLAGFFLASQWRWAFPGLMAEAIVIDFIAIRYFGVSNYCVTAAYWFLVPSYAVLWMGGSLLRRHHSFDLRGLASFVISLSVALSVCFLISNASFYWLGGRVADSSWNGWLSNMSDWYWPMLRVPLVYVGAVGLIYATVPKARAEVSRQLR